MSQHGIRGHVIDSTGSAVVDAVVRVGGYERALSDASGRFDLSLPPGTHKIEIQARGTLPERRTLTIPETPRGPGQLEIVLRPGLEIAGRVLGPDDKPLASMRLLAWPSTKDPPAQRSWKSEEALLGHDVFTGPDGRFVLTGLEAVPHEVLVSLASSPVWDLASTYLTRVMPGGPPIVFRLRDRGRVRGIVTDARTGAPVAAVTVNGIPQYEPDGRFDVPLHDALFVRAPGYAMEFRWLDEGQGAATALRVALSPAEGSVMARILPLDESGTRLRQAHLATGHNAQWGPRWTVLVPIPAGGYVLPVVPGQDTILVRTPDGMAGSAVAQSDLVDGATVHVNIHKPGAAVSLRLPPPSNPRHRAQLLIEATDGSTRTWCFVPETPYKLLGVTSIVWTREGTPTAIGLYDSCEDGVVERDARSLSRVGGVEAFVGRTGESTMIVGWRGRLSGLPSGTYRLTLRTQLGWDSDESIWSRSFTVGETWSAPVSLEPADQHK